MYIVARDSELAGFADLRVREETGGGGGGVGPHGASLKTRK